MNEPTTDGVRSPGITEADMHAVHARTKALIALVSGDSNGTALDALISAYVNEAYRRDRRASCAAMILRLGRLMMEDKLPTQGAAVINTPAPATAAPAGYSAEDVAAVEQLLDSLATLLHDVPGQVALSALLTMFLRVAEVQGDTVKAAEHLMATGARVVMEQLLAGKLQHASPAPAGATLH
jgi:hypothetical protein